jgi:hypothetical protein
VRELITDLRARLGRRTVLGFRMDAAFFQRDMFRLLAGRGCASAIKVGLLELAATQAPGGGNAPLGGRSGRHRVREMLDVDQWSPRLRGVRSPVRRASERP